MKRTVFWNATSKILAEIYQRFGGKTTSIFRVKGLVKQVTSKN
jgi:hypothetical protein